MGFADAIIAAIALAHGLPLVTRNVSKGHVRIPARPNGAPQGSQEKKRMAVPMSWGWDTSLYARQVVA